MSHCIDNVIYFINKWKLSEMCHCINNVIYFKSDIYLIYRINKQISIFVFFVCTLNFTILILILIW